MVRRSSLEAAVGLSELVEAGIDGIRRHPTAWPVWPGHPDVRRRVLRRFPYSVISLLERDEITIVAVAHHRRRPGYWLQRLRPR
ncbi:MAG: hypothetical protein ABL886_12675 [Rhodoglobus sp.]